MKDKLVFNISEINTKDKCSHCDVSRLCGTLLFSCECKNGEAYKLAEEEPVKVQTNPISKYEWYKDRLEIINDYMGELQFNNADPTKADKQLFKEIDWLKDYIKENKPTNFQPCTEDNTKVGSIIRQKDKSGVNTGKNEITMLIKNNCEYNIMVRNKDERDFPSVLYKFEIDINNTEE